MSTFRSERFFLLVGDVAPEDVGVLLRLEENAADVAVCERTSVEMRDEPVRPNETFLPRWVGETGTFFGSTTDLVCPRWRGERMLGGGGERDRAVGDCTWGMAATFLECLREGLNDDFRALVGEPSGDTEADIGCGRLPCALGGDWGANDTVLRLECFLEWSGPNEPRWCRGSLRLSPEGVVEMAPGSGTAAECERKPCWSRSRALS